MIYFYFLLLLFIVIRDIKTMRISNMANGSVLILGLIDIFSNFGLQSEIWLRSLASVFLVFGSLLIFAIATNGALGGGDIKLAAALTLPTAAIGMDRLGLAWIYLALSCIPIWIWARWTKKQPNYAIPFGPSIAFGYLMALV